MKKCSNCNKEVETINEEVIINDNKHIQAKCSICGNGLGFISQDIPAEETIMPFGKYKGKKIIEMPTDYICWLLNNDVVKGNLKYKLIKIWKK